MGRDTMGVGAIRLRKGDEVAGFDIVNPEGHVLVITQNGFGKLTPMSDYPVKSRNIQGVYTMDQTAIPKIGEIVGMRVVEDLSEELMVISTSGQVDSHPTRAGPDLRPTDAGRDHHAARRWRPWARLRESGSRRARSVTEVFRLADTYVDELCTLDPFTATDLGLPGHDDEVTDFSPDGVEALVDLDRRTLRALDETAVENDADRIARAVMRDRLDAGLESYRAGAAWRQLSNFVSPISFIRMAFDLARVRRRRTGSVSPRG